MSEMRTTRSKKAVSMPPKYKFKEGEKVLCINGLFVYEGICLAVETDDRYVHYYVHYTGWNKTYDEWLPESHILKYNKSNLIKVKEFKAAPRINPRTQRRRTRSGGKDPGNEACASTSLAEKSTSGKNKAPASTPSSSQDERRRTRSGGKDPGDEACASTSLAEKSTSGKNKAPASTPSSSQDASREVPQNEKGQFPTRVEVKLPDELKSLLVNDWEFICSRKKLMKLPSKVTVDEILENFVEDETSSENDSPYKKMALIEVTQGIRAYFNNMLGRQLLYKFERSQHTKILAAHPDVPMSRIYGAFHLLRFFVTLGRVLPRTPGDERNIQRLLAHIHDFLRYLNENRAMLFSVKEYAITGRKIRKKQ